MKQEMRIFKNFQEIFANGWAFIVNPFEHSGVCIVEATHGSQLKMTGTLPIKAMCETEVSIHTSWAELDEDGYAVEMQDIITMSFDEYYRSNRKDYEKDGRVVTSVTIHFEVFEPQMTDECLGRLRRQIEDRLRKLDDKQYRLTAIANFLNIL